jgi:hypothetical protein
MLPPIYNTLRQSAAVVAMVGTRIFRHGRAPQDVARPYVTWALITGTPENHLSGTPPVDNMTLQLDCWAEAETGDKGVETLATAVRDALETHAHMTGQPVDGREPDTNLWRIALQFDWWMDRVEV